MSFNIIKHKGAPQQAKTLGNTTVSRQEQLFIPEWGALVMCAPYDDHFIYENPDKAYGSSAYLCTCGSMAVVVPPEPTGMFVCHFHATYGHHTTSVVNKKDFGKLSGQTLNPAKKGTKWI